MPPAWTSRISSEACSAAGRAAPGGEPDPRRGPRGRTHAQCGGGVQRRPAEDHPRGPGGERGYDVTIPAGVVDGQRIRLAGEGGRGRGPGSAGDLYLVVRIAPHPRYRLVGRDIHVDLPVTAWEAALGAMVPVSGPGGTVKVHVPPGTSTGRRLRLRGEGMPHPKGSPGHLYAEIQVMVPPSPSPRERELFEELAAISSFDPREQT